jgi:hypothetical protein
LFPSESLKDSSPIKRQQAKNVNTGGIWRGSLRGVTTFGTTSFGVMSRLHSPTPFGPILNECKRLITTVDRLQVKSGRGRQ